MAIHQYKSGKGGSPPPQPSAPRHGSTGNCCFESIKRCERESDVISAIRYHSTPFADPSGRYPPEDPVAESIYVTLERDVVQRFQRGDYLLASGAFSLIAGFFRILYLVVSVPFYFCFYELPRCVFFELLPMLVAILKKNAIKIISPIILLKQRIAAFFATLISAITTPFRLVAEGWRKIKIIAGLFAPQCLYRKTITLLKIPFLALLKWQDHLDFWRRSLLTTLKSRVKAACLVLENALRNSLAPIETFLARQMLNLVMLPWRLLKRFYQETYYRCISLPLQILRNMKELCQLHWNNFCRFSHAIFDPVKRITEWPKRAKQQVKQLFIAAAAFNWLTLAKRVLMAFTTSLSKFWNHFQNHGSAFLLLAQGQIQKLSDAVFAPLCAWGQKIRSYSDEIGLRVKALCSGLHIPFFKSFSLPLSVSKMLPSELMRFKSKPEEDHNNNVATASMSRKGLLGIKRATAFLQGPLQMISTAFQHCCAYSVQMVQAVHFGFCWLTVWSVVLSRYGLVLVRQATPQLLGQSHSLKINL